MSHGTDLHRRDGWMRQLVRGVVALLLVGGLAEGGARALRADDVPLYRADNHIGYIPAPNQSGAFLWTHRWAFNGLSMGTAAAFRPGQAGSVLLIGDSIVLGGNPYRMNERLGPQLAAALHRPVWPVAANSWSLRNELQYLLDHPAVVRGVDRVVLVTNSGDFGPPSAWANELTHPRRRHALVTWQLFRKYLWVPPSPAVPAGLRVPARDIGVEMWRVLALARRAPVVIFFPNEAELGDTTPCGFRPAAVLVQPGLRRYCVKRSGLLRADLYRDGVHPTPAGTRLLAALIAAAVSREERRDDSLAGGAA